MDDGRRAFPANGEEKPAVLDGSRSTALFVRRSLGNRAQNHGADEMARPNRRAEPVERQAARILIVEARYYDEIADALLQGTTAALKEADVQFDCITVPGALEVPAAIAIAIDGAASRNQPYDGVVALGCVIRGETFHFEIVSTQSARALMDMSVARQLPIGNGILTVENEAQAMARANPKQGDKGGEAARAALTLIALKRTAAGKQ
jgi:6,7-dimethyl-8-ribityllumazine synthase